MDVSPDRLPVRVDKPWGYEIWYAWTDRYVGKILHVRRGHRLSLQYHREKDEASYLLRGRLLLTTGPTRGPPLRHRDRRGARLAEPPRPDPHRSRRSRTRTSLEVSTPELEDVVRLQDLYGREGTNRP